ncbi:hypothetical protein NP493_793g01001 [Ridgeia piscesae]|uniref:Endonuclease/exonuclease/phosphatase domain-containing protein n=1 Tax=Ridgeia piscesae TaxID=27915 RepID=A0AAD9KNV2_RIDPI|nr:hypothetical protein NP493_793g01001 [Ridgeia piscesae]
MCLNISNSCFSGHFICIYRPPGHPANFFEQFQDLLENVITIHSDFYIVGDFNLHLDTPSATTTIFNDILASFDTTQHVNFPTHIHGHWLDIIITRSSCKNIQTPTVVDGLSDHNTVIANLKVRTAPAVSKHNVFYRAFHSINIAAFMADITTSNLVTHPREHLSELYKQYHQILKTLLDKHAPIKTKSVSQIYISLPTPDACRSLNQLRDCLQDVSLWMKNSKLKLNANKTEFIIIGTVTQRAKLDGFFPTHILNQSVTPAPSVSNLGVNFDESFNFKQHISKTCRCCFYHIRDLRRIRRFLSLSVAKTIATALVSSRLDYCNSLLYNTANKDIARLQRAQNCLARVFTRSPRFSIALAPCALSHYFQDLHNILSSTRI